MEECLQMESTFVFTRTIIEAANRVLTMKPLVSKLVWHFSELVWTTVWTNDIQGHYFIHYTYILI